MNVLIVVDMQNDFVSGALGTPEAQKIVPAVVKRVKEGIRRGEQILFTRDTHGADYLHTREGRNLPVPHCIRGTEGWEIVEQLRPASAGQAILDKPSFGSAELGRLLAEENEKELIEKVTLIGLCTDICVLANVALLKAYCPEVPMTVRASCCAGVTPAGGRGSGGCRLLRRCHPGEPSDRACGHEELPDHRGTRGVALVMISTEFVAVLR